MPLKLLAAFVLATVCMGQLPAHARSPLVMEDKSTVFQRVLIRNDVFGLDQIDGTGALQLRPLESMYVYAREGEWLELGRGKEAAETVWVNEADTIPWHQNIVAMFEDKTVVPRVLFFETDDDAFGVIEAENPRSAAAALREEATALEGGQGTSQRIAALGPDLTVDDRQNFYVMPIVSHEDAVFDIDGADLKLLEVAIARPTNEVRVRAQTERFAPQQEREDYKVGIVFVVDTTTSMGPYIDETAELMNEVYERISQSQYSDSYAFGLVGYRDSTEAVPELEYVADTFVTLEEGRSAGAFFDGIARMTVAQASSRNFHEDSYSGVSHAIDALNWDGIRGRYIILVTDAGPRGADDQFSGTGLSAEGLRNIASETAETVLSVMHLKTAAGAVNHGPAEAAYRELTAQPGGAPLYFEISAGDRETYGEQARSFADIVIRQTDAFKSGNTQFRDEITGDGDDDAVFRSLQAANRAMQLRYLGERLGAEPPDVFQAYVADMDFDNRAAPVLSKRILVSKDDLNNLYESLSIIVDASQSALVDPDEMFNLIRSSAADMARSPEDVSKRGTLTLAEEVLIDEFLDGLPYTSKVMRYTPDDWARMGAAEKLSMEAGFTERLERYRRYNESPDLWFDYLGSGGDQADLLFAMPLTDLP